MFALAFDAELANKSAQDFVLDILVNGLGTGCVVPVIAPHGNILAARQSVEASR